MGGMETNYVGMSTDYGTCEMVPVAEVPEGGLITTSKRYNDEYLSIQPPIIFGATSGTMDPKDREECLLGLAITFLSLSGNITAISVLTDLASPESTFEKNVKSAAANTAIIMSTEGLFLGLSKLFTDPYFSIPALRLKLLSKLFAPSGTISRWNIFSELNANALTPPGLWKVGKETWNSCGRPGGGLWKRILEPSPQPVAELQPTPIPVAKRIEIPQPKPKDIAQVGIWTTLLAVGATMLKSLDLVLSRATGLFLLSPKEEDNLI